MARRTDRPYLLVTWAVEDWLDRYRLLLIAEYDALEAS